MEWNEVDKQRIGLIGVLMDRTMKDPAFGNNPLFLDFQYVLDSIRAANREIERLRGLLKERGIVTSRPEREKNE